MELGNWHTFFHRMVAFLKGVDDLGGREYLEGPLWGGRGERGPGRLRAGEERAQQGNKKMAGQGGWGQGERGQMAGQEV